jgi:hypothetical protein
MLLAKNEITEAEMVAAKATKFEISRIRWVMRKFGKMISIVESQRGSDEDGDSELIALMDKNSWSMGDRGCKDRMFVAVLIRNERKPRGPQAHAVARIEALLKQLISSYGWLYFPIGEELGGNRSDLS